MRLPIALKIFLWSLVWGLAGGYLAFRVAVFIALRFIEGEHREVMANLIGLLVGWLLGICSAVTAGVMAGRSAKGGPPTA
jgi:uncharacterized membrane protein YraQ (UPF0718 family)